MYNICATYAQSAYGPMGPGPARAQAPNGRLLTLPFLGLGPGRARPHGPVCTLCACCTYVVHSTFVFHIYFIFLHFPWKPYFSYGSILITQGFGGRGYAWSLCLKEPALDWHGSMCGKRCWSGATLSSPALLGRLLRMRFFNRILYNMK